jgi:hypothetical protein
VGKNFAVLDIFFYGMFIETNLKTTEECQISTLIFEKNIVKGDLYKYPIKNISRTAKFLPTFG